jgi:alpha-amylase
MVQLFEWPWRAVAEECERYLGPAGFAAVQVSPPTEHMRREEATWWERYQPVSHRLESRAGTEAEFAEMVGRCRAVGVDIYADVVLNHMAGFASGVGFAGSAFEHYQYPDLFAYQDFHHCGRNGNDDILDFTSIYELQNCELLNLADLNTGAPYVRSKLAELLQRLLDYGVAGFRLDAAKHMSPGDILGILDLLRGPFYTLQELIISPGEPVRVEDYLPIGDVNVFPYAYAVGEALLAGDPGRLAGIGRNLGVSSEQAVVLLENHDLERRPVEETVLPFVKDPVRHRLALAFQLTWPYGYPQLYSGFYFTDYDQGPPVDEGARTLSPLAADGACVAPWTCAHRAPGVAELVRFRNLANRHFRATDIHREAGVLAFGRGPAGHVVIHTGETPRTLTVRTRLRDGEYVDRFTLGGAGTLARVAQGRLTVTVPPHSAFVAMDEGALVVEK